MPDSYYHGKILAGLLQPLQQILTEVEQDAMFHGRTHGDDSRLEAYHP